MNKFKYYCLFSFVFLALIGMILLYNKNKYYIVISEIANSKHVTIINTNTGKIHFASYIKEIQNKYSVSGVKYENDEIVFEEKPKSKFFENIEKENYEAIMEDMFGENFKKDLANYQANTSYKEN